MRFMNLRILLSIVFAILIGTARNLAPGAIAMTLPLEVDLAAFDTMEDAVLVDCRTPEERLEAAIADQAFVPMDEASARIEDFKSWEDQGTVVIYCRSGRRSLNLTIALREAGVENVCSLAGGIQGWISEGREVQSGS